MKGYAGLGDLLGIGDEEAWRDDALCAQTDTDAFFPEKGENANLAKAVCALCSVRAECLEYALANNLPFGIWGGLSEMERRKVKRRRSAERTPAQHTATTIPAVAA